MLTDPFHDALRRARHGAARMQTRVGSRWFDLMSRDHLSFNRDIGGNARETPAAQFSGESDHAYGCRLLGYWHSPSWIAMDGFEPLDWNDPIECDALARAWIIVITEALEQHLAEYY